jgi:hypothetical protein
MPYVTPGGRLCGYNVVLHSALKKAGKLYQQYCWKCNMYCWIFDGDRLTYIYADKFVTQ